MNFLLYMIGRAAGNGMLRPDRRQALIARAAADAVAGRFDLASERYLQLATNGNIVDRLILGQLSVVTGKWEKAIECLGAALEELFEGDLPGGEKGRAETSLSGALDVAERHLASGRYERAMGLLRRARSRLEVIVAAEGLLVVAEEAGSGHRDLAGLGTAARMGDCFLHLMARVQLVRHVSAGLGARRLREDLASWATGDNRVRALLEREMARLGGAENGSRNNAQALFRSGLLARALGHAGGGAGYFAQVMAIHPGHVPSAARLTIARAAMGMPAGRELLGAFCVPAETLELFGRVAGISRSPRVVDRVAEKVCAGLPGGDATAVRGNLFLALGEVGVDGGWEHGRESPESALPESSNSA